MTSGRLRRCRRRRRSDRFPRLGRAEAAGGTAGARPASRTPTRRASSRPVATSGATTTTATTRNDQARITRGRGQPTGQRRRRAHVRRTTAPAASAGAVRLAAIAAAADTTRTGIAPDTVETTRRSAGADLDIELANPTDCDRRRADHRSGSAGTANIGRWLVGASVPAGAADRNHGKRRNPSRNGKRVLARRGVRARQRGPIHRENPMHTARRRARERRRSTSTDDTRGHRQDRATSAPQPLHASSLRNRGPHQYRCTPPKAVTSPNQPKSAVGRAATARSQNAPPFRVATAWPL